MLNAYTRNNYIEQILGYHIPYADDETVASLKKKKVVKKMPAYPDEGSIAIIDDVLVIKLRRK